MVNTDGEGLAFILSTPRAGSTLLAALLGSHSQIHCPPEPWMLLPLVSMRDRNQLVAAPYDYRLAIQGAQEFLGPAVFRNALAAFATTAYGASLKQSHKSVLVDKTPRYYHILPALDELFPKAVQIWIRRNPLDTIQSCIDTWQLPLNELLGDVASPYTFDTTISFELLARHFAKGGPRRLSLKYEDLVVEPARVLAPVCAALGLEFEPAMLRYGDNAPLMANYRKAQLGDKKLFDDSAPHTRSLDRWREKLSPDEVAQILRVLGQDIFERTGYREQLTQALAYTRLDPNAVSHSGRLAELLDIRNSYGQLASTVDLLTAGAGDRTDLQYTFQGQLTQRLQEAAEERMQLIRNLNADAEERLQLIGSLKSEAEERLAAAEERLTLIQQLELDLARVGHLAEEKEQVITDMKGFADAQAERIDALQAALHAAEARGAEARRETAALEAKMAAASAEAQQEAAAETARTEAAAAAAAAARAIPRRPSLRSKIRRRMYAFWSPRIGVLQQYPARELVIPAWYPPAPSDPDPSVRMSIVTPTLNQREFIERTIKSVQDQNYPNLEYIVQDGLSTDGTQAVLHRYADFLSHIESARDTGFGQAINRGFQYATGEIMAYLNSDDVLLPGALQYIGRYFERHPEVDVVYGHRVIIDPDDREIGRWVLPPDDSQVLSWADYVPQETLFWRRSIWLKSGGQIDESFRFAIDWDLLFRFRESGAKMVRLPRFLGAFRLHPRQKTSRQMEGIGVAEMDRIRERAHGRTPTMPEIHRALRPYLRRSLIEHKLYRAGLLKY